MAAGQAHRGAPALGDPGPVVRVTAAGGEMVAEIEMVAGDDESP